MGPGTKLEFAGPPSGARGPKGGPRDGLTSVEDKSAIAEIGRDPRGQPEVLVLESGSIVRLSPRLRDDAGASLKVGSKVTVSGEGGTYGKTKAMRAGRLELESGQVFSDPGRGPGPGPGPGGGR